MKTAVVTMLVGMAVLSAVESTSDSLSRLSTAHSEITLAGCLQPASDSPDAFMLRPGIDTIAAWSTGLAPVYRVTGTNLRTHVGHTVELTGSVSGDKITGATTDITIAPQLTVTKLKMVSANCTPVADKLGSA